MEYDQGQAGAIAVPPAMVEAGAAILLRCYDSPGAVNDTDREMVLEIIRAVADASDGHMLLCPAPAF